MSPLTGVIEYCFYSAKAGWHSKISNKEKRLQARVPQHCVSKNVPTLASCKFNGQKNELAISTLAV